MLFRSYLAEGHSGAYISDVLFIPLIFPLLYACVSATTAVIVGAEGYADIMLTSLALAGGYDVIMILASWVLYDFVISA